MSARTEAVPRTIPAAPCPDGCPGCGRANCPDRWACQRDWHGSETYARMTPQQRTAYETNNRLEVTR